MEHQQAELESLFTTRYEDLPDPDLFPDLSVEVWTEALWRANELANLYTDLQVARVLARLERGTVGLIRTDAHRESCLRWLEDKHRQSVFGSTSRESVEEIQGEFADGLRETILAADPALEPTLDLIDVAGQGYTAFFGDGIDGQSVLFAPHTLSLWERYFSTENPLYQPTNTLAASAAAEVAGDAPERRLRVLEVGAGCGSGSVTLLSHLSGRVEKLVLTDISPNFLRKARERVDAAPGAESVDVEARLLDLNRPIDTWRLEPSSRELVFAVNVLHTVQDPVASLRGLRDVLVDGGHVVLGECVRPGDRCLHPEFIFQLLADFVGAGASEGRPGRGFLEPSQWRAVLQEAGFSMLRFVPDFDRIAQKYSEYSLAAIVARK